MKRILLSLFLVCTTTLLLAWGQNGHRIVAQICWDNLPDYAKKEVEKILGKDYLTQVATWPDYIRSEKEWDFTKSWHFITVDNGRTVQQVMDSCAFVPSIDNVIEAIEMMKGILKNKEAPTRQFQELVNKNSAKLLGGSIKATALAFLIHFIGDIHQPMHVGKSKDAGGNLVKVLFFSEKTNLHSVWDEGIIEKEQLCFTEFASFVNKDQASNKADWQATPIYSWATESITIRNIIYSTLKNNIDKTTKMPDLSYQYQHDFIPTVEERLGAAGYRAAYVLSEIFK